MPPDLDGYAEVPVDEYGASLLLPRELLGELMARGSEPVERVDFPVIPLPVGNRSSLQGLGNQPSHAVLLDNIKGWPAIAGAAVSRRVRGLAKKLHVYSEHMQGGELVKREQPDHRLAATLKNPNSVFTLGDMLWLLTWHLQQVGEGYWQRINDGLGLTTELWPLPPSNVVPVADDQVGIAGYMVSDGKGNEHALGLDEVIRFWSPDPKTLFSSMGVLGPQAVEYDQSRFLEDHLRSHFENDATPKMAIVGKADQATIDPKVQRAFTRKWRSMYNARVGTARSMPAFIPAGWDIKEMSAHGAAAEVIPLRESNREQILASYGVPSTTVGLDKNVNRATAEANDFTFDKNTVTYYTDLIAEALTVRLATSFDPKLRVAFREFVAPDKAHDLAVEGQDLDKGVRSVQQILRDRNAKPSDAPWGEVPIQSSNVSPYDGNFSMEDRAKLIGASAISSAAPRTDAPKRLNRIGALSMTRDHPLDVEAAQRRAVAHGQQFTGPLTTAVLGVLKSQRLDVEEKLRALPAAEWLISPEVVIEPRSHGRASGDIVANLVFNPAEWDGVFSAELEDHIREAFLAAANDATKTVAKEEFVFSMFSQEAVKTQTFKLAGQVDQTTLRHVAVSIQGALDNGEGVDGAIKRLRSVFNRPRARVIANTEILTAVQTGQLHGWRSTEQVIGKQWHVSGNNTRDSHSLADGQIVGLEELFILGSGAMCATPGDTTLDAADRVNCQCFVTPILIEL